MKFDADTHRCAIVIDQKISGGLAINAASVIAIGLGKNVSNLVGKDLQSLDHRHYPGVIYSPLPVLTACEAHIKEIFASAEKDDDIYIMPFSSLAQSCKTYDEYEGKIASVSHYINNYLTGRAEYDISQRKQMTTFNTEIHYALQNALTEVESDNDMRAIMITGAGALNLAYSAVCAKVSIGIFLVNIN
ncbi:MAG: hypothetical protein CR977_03505 [Gammaproteobacteria bacterium]|nr:MAG: hypothetical protein CR977_03505 [Gammaproteobacteria bacterium]